MTSWVIFGLICVVVYFMFFHSFDFSKEFKPSQNTSSASIIPRNTEHDTKLLEDIPRTEFVQFIINYLKVNSPEILSNVRHSKSHYNSHLIKLTNSNGFFLCPGFVYNKHEDVLIIADYALGYSNDLYMKKEIPYETTYEERYILRKLIEDAFEKSVIAKKNQELLILQKEQREKEQALYKELANNKNVIILSSDEMKELEELDSQNKELKKLS